MDFDGIVAGLDGDAIGKNSEETEKYCTKLTDPAYCINNHKLHQFVVLM